MSYNNDDNITIQDLFLLSLHVSNKIHDQMPLGLLPTASQTKKGTFKIGHGLQVINDTLTLYGPTGLTLPAYRESPRTNGSILYGLLHNNPTIEMRASNGIWYYTRWKQVQQPGLQTSTPIAASEPDDFGENHTITFMTAYSSPIITAEISGEHSRMTANSSITTDGNVLTLQNIAFLSEPGEYTYQNQFLSLNVHVDPVIATPIRDSDEVVYSGETITINVPITFNAPLYSPHGMIDIAYISEEDWDNYDEIVWLNEQIDLYNMNIDALIYNNVLTGTFGQDDVYGQLLNIYYFPISQNMDEYDSLIYNNMAAASYIILIDPRDGESVILNPNIVQRQNGQQDLSFDASWFYDILYSKYDGDDCIVALGVF